MERAHCTAAAKQTTVITWQPTTACPPTYRMANKFSRFELPGFNLPIDFAPRVPDAWPRGTRAVLFKNALDNHDREDGLLECVVSVALMRTPSFIWPCQTPTDYTSRVLHASFHEQGDGQAGMARQGGSSHFSRTFLTTAQVFNEAITSNWKREALASGDDFSERMADWCIAELQYKAKVFEETGVVGVVSGDVVKSDTAIPATIQEELKVAVKLLEGVPEKLKD